MDEQIRLKAREFLLRARIYRFIGTVFAVIGLIVFLIIYFRHVEGDVFHALKNPALVLMVLIPFLPAFILARMAAKSERQFMKLLDQIKDASAKTGGEAAPDKKT